MGFGEFLSARSRINLGQTGKIIERYRYVKILRQMCYAAHKASPPVLRRRGVGDACRLYEERGEINWDARKKNLKASWTSIAVKTEVIGILVPVSGGKR